MSRYEGPVHIEEIGGRWKIVKGEDPEVTARLAFEARPPQVGDIVVIGPHNNGKNISCGGGLWRPN